MATWKSTPEERAQAAQLVLKRVDAGEALAEAVRHLARALEVSEDTLRRWVRQETAKAEVAEPPVAPEPVFAPPAAPATPLYVPVAQPQGRSTALTVVAIVGAAFVGVIVLCVAAVTFLGTPRERAEDRVADYAAGKGTHEFVATDSNFRASFPFGAPRRSIQTNNVGGTSQEFVMYGTETDSGAFMVGSFALPPGATYDLNAGVNGAAVGMAGHIETATATTIEGKPAIEFVITGTESGHQFVDNGFVVNSGSRVYVLQAIWEDHPSPGYDAFKASFHIGL